MYYNSASVYHQFLQLRKKPIIILLEQNMTSTPTLLWSQTPESVDITIRLPNIEEETVSCENNKFLFSCSSQSKNYRIEFDLDKSVEKVSYDKYDNRIAIVLEKAEYEKWEFLTKVRGIYKNNIKIDWDKWEDEDSEGEEKPEAPSSGFGGMDMDSMRQMMGGMNMGGEEGEGEEGEGEGEEECDGEDDGGEDEKGEGDGDEGEEDECEEDVESSVNEE